MISSSNLNAANEVNLQNAGSIAAVTTIGDNTLFLKSVDEFKPEVHILHIDQIWTPEQEVLVRMAMDWIKPELDTEGDLEDWKEYAHWQEMLIEWLDGKEDLTTSGLND